MLFCIRVAIKIMLGRVHRNGRRAHNASQFRERVYCMYCICTVYVLVLVYRYIYVFALVCDFAIIFVLVIAYVFAFIFSLVYVLVLC